MEKKREKIEEKNIQELVAEFLKQEKIRENLQKVSEKSKEKLKKSVFKRISLKKTQETEISHKKDENFDDKFSLIQAEYRKIMNSWRNGEFPKEKTIEKPLFMKKNIEKIKEKQNNEKIIEIKKKFDDISKKMARILQSKSEILTKKDEFSFKQTNFLQILNEEEEKDNKSSLKEIVEIPEKNNGNPINTAISEKNIETQISSQNEEKPIFSEEKPIFSEENPVFLEKTIEKAASETCFYKESDFSREKRISVSLQDITAEEIIDISSLDP